MIWVKELLYVWLECCLKAKQLGDNETGFGYTLINHSVMPNATVG